LVAKTRTETAEKVRRRSRFLGREWARRRVALGVSLLAARVQCAAGGLLPPPATVSTAPTARVGSLAARRTSFATRSRWTVMAWTSTCAVFFASPKGRALKPPPIQSACRTWPRCDPRTRETAPGTPGFRDAPPAVELAA